MLGLELVAVNGGPVGVGGHGGVISNMQRYVDYFKLTSVFLKNCEWVQQIAGFRDVS